MKYKVRSLSLSGRGSKIFKSGDIVDASDFKHNQISKLINEGLIEKINTDTGSDINSMDLIDDDLLIIIFTYKRKSMLEAILSHLNNYNVIVIDDGSPYKIRHSNVISFSHGGKSKYWEKWDKALSLAQESTFNKFIFMPDDFLDINIPKISQLHTRYKNNPYVYNIINDDREWSWIKFKPVKIADDTYRIGFTDCGFFCNRSALEAIGFYMVPIRRRGKIVSSGVGHQLTHRFTRAGVPFYKPLKSLAYHGDHPSVMHPQHRIDNPIISK